MPTTMMRARSKSRRFRLGAAVASAGAVVAAGLMLLLLSPAQAQFWSPFGSPRRPPAPVQQSYPGYNNQGYNPFGGFFGPPPQEQRREAPPDNSHAPAPQARKADTPPTTSIVVLGDAMADWLAYGLEDAYSERPEMGILRKYRTGSGLVRYDPKRDVDWAQTAREIITAEKPKIVVMMIGTNDHQVIRERAQPAKPANGGKPAAAPGPTDNTPTEDGPGVDAEAPDQGAPEAGRSAGNATGTFEFHTDQWEAAYIKRIDATIAAMKSSGATVLWVGLPAQRGPKATADSSYLNDLYRSRAERAGIIYVDVWDGFVDEQGRYSPQGPDFEGQTRRLRSADGVYFTKAGARKLANYVEREIDRTVANRALPMPLPATVETNPLGGKPGGSSRPLAGPVVPLTVSVTGGAAEELLGGAKPPARPTTSDPLATRVLTKGEAITPPVGRADDFSWPRGGAANVAVTNEPASAPPATAVAAAPPTAPAPAPASPAAAKGAGKPPSAASAPAQPTTTAQAATAGAATPTEAPDDSKPKVARRPAPKQQQSTVPRPFATIPNIFR